MIQGRGNRSSAALVLAARLIVLLAAAALAITGFALAGRGESTAAAATERFACPMHPDVTATSPAQCPICKMDLEPIDSVGRAPEHAPAAPEATPSTQHAYACPMHPEVAARMPGQCHLCKMDLEPVGEKPEQPQASVIPVASSIHAPGVLWLPETFPPAQPGKPQDRPPIGAAKQRVFVEKVRAPAWLEAPDRLAAVLYRDQLAGLSSGEPGSFFRAAASRAGIDVRLSDEPPVPWDASTSLVRFVVEPRKAPRGSGRDALLGAAPELRSGDVGWLELPPKSRELLVFPESALLRSTESPYVLVPRADGHTFARRPVQIGRIIQGHVVVLSGLEEGDRLVIGKAFFLDASARLDARAEPVAEVAQ